MTSSALTLLYGQWKEHMNGTYGMYILYTLCSQSRRGGLMGHREWQ